MPLFVRFFRGGVKKGYVRGEWILVVMTRKKNKLSFHYQGQLFRPIATVFVGLIHDMGSVEKSQASGTINPLPS